jgi:hypothetical protein
LPEIEVEHLFGVALDHAGIEHQVGDGAVAVAGFGLGAIDRLVDLEPSPGEGREQIDHMFHARLGRGAFGERRDGDGAGIDHRVEGAVVLLVEDDGIEGLARGLDADLFQHGLLPEPASAPP